MIGKARGKRRVVAIQENRIVKDPKVDFSGHLFLLLAYLRCFGVHYILVLLYFVDKLFYFHLCLCKPQTVVLLASPLLERHPDSFTISDAF